MCWLNNRSYALISGVVFVLIALLHLWRALVGLPAQLGNWNAPLWISWLAFIIAGWLALEAFRLARK